MRGSLIFCMPAKQMLPLDCDPIPKRKPLSMTITMPILQIWYTAQTPVKCSQSIFFIISFILSYPFCLKNP